MKKCLILLLAAVFILCSGCTLPIEKTSGEAASATTRSSDSLHASTPEATGSPAAASAVNPRNTVMNLYYQDKDGKLIPVTRRVEKQEALAKTALLGLIDSAATREELEYYGLYPVLPKGTEILGISLKEGRAVIDFNDKLLDYATASAEKSIFGSIVYTLTEFKTIQKVRILVKGKTPAHLKFNTDVSGDLGRANTLINADTLNLKQSLSKADVYVFRKAVGKFSHILPVSVTFPDTRQTLSFEKVFEAIKNTGIQASYSSEFPEKAGVLSSKMSGSTLVLDLNGAFRNYGGTAREQGIIQQILYTAGQWQGIAQVKLSIAGKDDYLPEGTELSKPIPIPREINDVIDRPGGA